MPSLTPEVVVAAYSQGLFPMASDRESSRVDWYSPDPRAVLPLEGFHCSRSLRKAIRQGRFRIERDTEFEAVIRACAAPRTADPETWINETIIQTYTDLARIGIGHSVEAWLDGCLVGGLYGIALGGAFFAESMFHRADLGGTDASKVCLAHLVEHLGELGFALLDLQILTDATLGLGAIEIPRQAFLARLQRALRLPIRF